MHIAHEGHNDFFILTLYVVLFLVDWGIQLLPHVKFSQQEIGQDHPYLRQNMIASTSKTTKDDLQTEGKSMLIKGQEKFRAWEPHIP